LCVCCVFFIVRKRDEQKFDRRHDQKESKNKTRIGIWRQQE
jgi:hypothetical protein